jgi:hypothetical protein
MALFTLKKWPVRTGRLFKQESCAFPYDFAALGSYPQPLFIEDAESTSFLRLEQSVNPAAAFFFKLQQNLLLMTAMRDVPHKAGKKIAIRSGHHVLLKRPFSWVKRTV